MDIKTILISAAVGVVTSAITAYVTTRLKIKEEKDKWYREFAMKFAEAQSTDRMRAQKMAVQLAIGVLIFQDEETQERERIFIPPNCRLVAGRAHDNPIRLNDIRASKHHCAFNANDTDVFVEDLGSGNATFVNSQRITGRFKLGSGDIVRIGQTECKFHKLDKS
jgi:pSer/pThr/pTyr-binding forkhead associated (FHA) protein